SAAGLRTVYRWLKRTRGLQLEILCKVYAAVTRARGAAKSARFARAAARSALDPGEIGNRKRRNANFIEQAQAIGADRLFLGVNRDLVEERIDVGAQLRHGAHGGGEILAGDGRRGFTFRRIDRASELALLRLRVKLRIGRAGKCGAVALLLD